MRHHLTPTPVRKKSSNALGYSVIDTLRVPVFNNLNGESAVSHNSTMISTKSKNSIKKDLKSIGKGVVKTVEKGVLRKRMNISGNSSGLSSNKSKTRKKKLGIVEDKLRNHLRLIENDRKMPLTSWVVNSRYFGF